MIKRIKYDSTYFFDTKQIINTSADPKIVKIKFFFAIDSLKFFLLTPNARATTKISENNVDKAAPKIPILGIKTKFKAMFKIADKIVI